MTGPPRHGRAGPGQPLRQRHPRAGRAAALLPRLPGDRAARARRGGAGRGGRRRRLPRERLRAASAARRPRCRASTREGEYDLAGFIVGVVERDRLDRRRERCGPATRCIGLPSTGLHTNGYSLARAHRLRRSSGWPSTRSSPELGLHRSATSCSRVHRSYLPVIEPLLDAGLVKGLAHITGGGITDNLPRILPAGHGRAHRHVARGRRTPCSGSCSAPAACPKTTCTAPSTWASA